MVQRVVALTTVDNPFDPVNQFDDWFGYDSKKGYGTCSYLARIAHTSETMPEQTNDAEIERAIDEIVANDPFGLYIKVVKESII